MSDSEKVAREIQKEIKKMLFSEVSDKRQHNIINFYYNFLNDSNVKLECRDMLCIPQNYLITM